MQLGMKVPHDHSALYVMISKPNVEWKLQRDFFNTIGGKRPVCCATVRPQEQTFASLQFIESYAPIHAQILKISNKTYTYCALATD